MAKGGKKVKADDLYVCSVCGTVYSFDEAFAHRGERHIQTGKRRFKCFNPTCENWIEEE